MSMPLPANKNRIADLLKQEQYDVLHVQMPYSPFMAAKLIKAAPQNTKVIGTFPHSALRQTTIYGYKALFLVVAIVADKV